jgi:regulator of replication initiation timing
MSDFKKKTVLGMCMTWRHDFELEKRTHAFGSCGTTEEERANLIQRMSQLYEHHVAPYVAENERLERKNSNQAETIKQYQNQVSGGDLSLGMLIAERDQLKAENERLRKLPTCWSEVLEQAEANDELLDKVLELSADAERYRFLCNKFGETKLPCALERILAGDLYVADGKSSIGSAIDAAMRKGEQS